MISARAFALFKQPLEEYETLVDCVFAVHRGDAGHLQHDESVEPRPHGSGDCVIPFARKMNLSCFHSAANRFQIRSITGGGGREDAFVSVDVEHEFVKLAISSGKSHVCNSQPAQHIVNIAAFLTGASEVSGQLLFSALNQRADNLFLTCEVCIGPGDAASEAFDDIAKAESVHSALV